MQSAKTDRRCFDRFVARFPVKFKDSRNDYGTDVFLRDLSADGTRIVTKEEMLINDKVTLLVEVPDGHDPLRLHGEVVWIKDKGAGSREVGIRFDAPKFMTVHRLYRFCQ